jgi:hypothetical protein
MKTFWITYTNEDNETVKMDIQAQNYFDAVHQVDSWQLGTEYELEEE